MCYTQSMSTNKLKLAKRLDQDMQLELKIIHDSGGSMSTWLNRKDAQDIVNELNRVFRVSPQTEE